MTALDRAALLARMLARALPFALLAALPGWAQAAPGQAARPALTIGVLAWRGGEKARGDWEATRRAFQAAFGEYRVGLRPLSLDGMAAALAAGELDFFITNPGNYIDMEARYGASRLVTLETAAAGAPGRSIGAAIFTRAERDDNLRRRLNSVPS